MSLDKRLKKSKDKGEEKIITLRMPQNKVTLLEMLAKHYEVNMSTLIREMIDESIIKLQHEMLLLSEEAGLKSEKGGEAFDFRYFPDLVELMVPELHSDPRLLDSNYDERSDDKHLKAIDLSIKYGTLSGSSYVDTKGVKHEFGISKQGDKK